MHVPPFHPSVDNRPLQQWAKLHAQGERLHAVYVDGSPGLKPSQRKDARYFSPTCGEGTDATGANCAVNEGSSGCVSISGGCVFRRGSHFLTPPLRSPRLLELPPALFGLGLA